MKPIDLIKAKKQHIKRLANKQGAAGEVSLIEKMENWIPRPHGKELKTLLESLRRSGIEIKATSFDAIYLPNNCYVDLSDQKAVEALLPEILFIEIKTANQKRVLPGFVGYFFALTEAEIEAADKLGSKHCVALYNSITGELLITSVSEILNRAKSKTWQLSVQL